MTLNPALKPAKTQKNLPRQAWVAHTLARVLHASCARVAHTLRALSLSRTACAFLTLDSSLVCCHNFIGCNGFRMDSALHSAHPYE